MAQRGRLRSNIFPSYLISRSSSTKDTEPLPQHLAHRRRDVYQLGVYCAPD